jgi:hypothetical protein
MGNVQRCNNCERMHREVENPMATTTTAEKVLYRPNNVAGPRLCKRKYDNYINVNKPSAEGTAV